MKINRTLHGDSAEIVVFTKKNVHFTEDGSCETLAGYHLLPFAVGDDSSNTSCRENKVANAQAQNTRHM